MKWLVLALLIAVGAAAQEPPRDRQPLTDEQKAQMEQRANENWSKLPPEAKMQVLRLHSALNQMPPEERQFIHERIKRFVEMTPEERQRLKENGDRWKKMSPEQREKAREQFRQQRKEFEDKWRQEHPGEEPPFPPRGHKPPPAENRETKTENPQKENP
ncbi:MAG: DUF3106 domain-containing protein [Verrucomicrobiota bacterium]